jgi:hypothetical protein
MTERYENQILNLNPKSVTEYHTNYRDIDMTVKVGDRWFLHMSAVGDIPETNHEYQIQGIIDTGIEDMDGPVVQILLVDIPNDEFHVWPFDLIQFIDEHLDGSWIPVK